MDQDVTQAVATLVNNIETVIYGKREAVELCVTGLLAQGHVLIEDIPGIGKTTLAQALARSIDCTFNRIQFTSDMLPSDILGVSVLDPKSNDFEFRPGPVFASIVLADEINRTPPKTQSALLEAMSEYHVSVDGVSHPLPKPFMVLATQNPIEYEGTYVLPESQLDRFTLRIEVGYPGQDDEMRIIRRRDPRSYLENLRPVLRADDVIALQRAVGNVIVEDSVAQYLLDVVRNTRQDERILLGASPRAAVSYYEACQARALVKGRDYVSPDDVKQLAVPVLSHRILVRARGADPAAIARERVRAVYDALKRVPVPV
jgi:MoxR-like ATPase